MIYCVEDDRSIREIEVYTLCQTGFEAVGLADAAELKKALAENRPELIILDVMLPGQDGVSILKELRKDAALAAVPVIMATAKGAEYDKITALDLGADDYLVKPFGMMEMVSRVRAVLRRSGGREEERKILKLGELTVDTAAHLVTAAGKRVELTLKEYQLLVELMSHPGVVCTRDRLLADIWETDYCGETRTVDVHVRTLRSKIGSCQELIETVRGVGYRMGVRP